MARVASFAPERSEGADDATREVCHLAARIDKHLQNSEQCCALSSG